MKLICENQVEVRKHFQVLHGKTAHLTSHKHTLPVLEIEVFNVYIIKKILITFMYTLDLIARLYVNVTIHARAQNY